MFSAAASRLQAHGRIHKILNLLYIYCCTLLRFRVKITAKDCGSKYLVLYKSVSSLPEKNQGLLQAGSEWLTSNNLRNQTDSPVGIRFYSVRYQKVLEAMFPIISPQQTD